LTSGAKIRAIGQGTFGSDHVSHSAVADAIRYAVFIGHRHFDCASVYGNDPQIGHVLKELFAEGFRRGEFWITSKLWNDKHGENVISACEKIPERSADRLPRSVSGSLAFSQPPSSGMRPEFAQQSCCPLHP
jgi:diketogulonate reductase-like aldo/keto reductase